MKDSVYSKQLAAYMVITGLMGWLLSKTTGLYQLLSGGLTAIVLIIMVRYFHLSADELGLRRNTTKSGVVWAIPIIVVVGFIGLCAFVASPNLFLDQRYDQSFISLVYMVAITIPLRTVLVEELLFRGILFAMLNRKMSRYYAVIGSSVVFGLWHIFSARSIKLQSTEITGNIEAYGTMVGIIFVTFCAGLIFSWLRIKSNSLITPILVHWAINSTGVLFAYLAWL